METNGTNAITKCPNGHKVTSNLNGYAACATCGAMRNGSSGKWFVPKYCQCGNYIPARIPELPDVCERCRNKEREIDTAAALQALADWALDNAAHDCPEIIYAEVTPEEEIELTGDYLVVPRGLRIAFGGNCKPAEFKLTIERVES